MPLSRHVGIALSWTPLPLGEGKTRERNGTLLSATEWTWTLSFPLGPTYTRPGDTGILTAPPHTTLTSLPGAIRDLTSTSGEWRWDKPECQVALVLTISFSLIAAVWVWRVEAQLILDYCTKQEMEDQILAQLPKYQPVREALTAFFTQAGNRRLAPCLVLSTPPGRGIEALLLDSAGWEHGGQA